MWFPAKKWKVAVFLLLAILLGSYIFIRSWMHDKPEKRTPVDVSAYLVEEKIERAKRAREKRRQDILRDLAVPMHVGKNKTFTPHIPPAEYLSKQVPPFSKEVLDNVARINTYIGIADKRERLAELEKFLGSRVEAEFVERHWLNLHVKYSTSKIDEAKELMSGGYVKDTQWYPLHEAAWCGWRTVVELLLVNGADISSQDKRSTRCLTPFECAVMRGHNDVVELMIERGAWVGGGVAGEKSVFCFFQIPPLAIAVRQGHADIVAMLLLAGADPEESYSYVSSDGPALRDAARFGRLGIARILIAYGADIHGSGGLFEETPLNVAARMGDIEMAKLLLDSGANVEDGDAEITPLMAAACAGHIEMAKLLIESGADIQRRCSSGIPAIGYAQIKGQREMERFLREMAESIGPKDQ